MKNPPALATRKSQRTNMFFKSSPPITPWHNEQSKRLPSGLLGPIAIAIEVTK